MKKRDVEQALRRHLHSRPGRTIGAGALSPDADDRTIAIVAATVLTHSLEDCILGHLIHDPELRKRLFTGDHEREGLIGNLLAQAWLGYGMNLFGAQTRDDINTIRRVRNVFAHSADLLFFSSPAIDAACQFSLVERSIWGGLLGPKPITPKMRYIVTADLIGIFLTISVDDAFKDVRESHKAQLRALLP